MTMTLTCVSVVTCYEMQ